MTELVGDKDREQAAEALSRAFTAGMLNDDEHEARKDLAARARTRSDLNNALHGIPSSVAKPLVPRLAADVDEPARPAPEVTAGSAGDSLAQIVLQLLALLAAFALVISWGQGEQSASRSAVVRDINEGWKHIDRVVRAQQKLHAETGKFTASWATLQVVDPDLTDTDADRWWEMHLGDHGVGVVVTYATQDWYELTAIVHRSGRVTRRCTPPDGAEACPGTSKPAANTKSGTLWFPWKG